MTNSCIQRIQGKPSIDLRRGLTAGISLRCILGARVTDKRRGSCANKLRVFTHAQLYHLYTNRDVLILVAVLYGGKSEIVPCDEIKDVMNRT